MGIDLTSTLPDLPLPKPVQAQAATPSKYAGMDETAKRAAIGKTAKDYEASFLSIMLGQMFEGTSATTFGGGQGEEAFKSFLTNAMAKSMVKHGGVGLSGRLNAEMLKMQGLSQTPTATVPAPAKTAAPMPAAAQPQTLDIAA